MRRLPTSVLVVFGLIATVMLSLAFIAFSERGIYLCGKTGSSCRQHTGLEAELIGFLFLGAALLCGSHLLKNSRYWPLYYLIPGLYGVSVLVYFVVRLIP